MDMKRFMKDEAKKMNIKEEKTGEFTATTYLTVCNQIIMD